MIGKLNKACRDEINAEKDQHKEKKQELLEVSELLFQARMKLKVGNVILQLCFFSEIT